MRAATIVAILLIVIGVISLTFGAVTYTTHKNVLDVGPIHATETQHKSIPLPPLLGIIALAGGILILVVGRGAHAT